MTRAAERCDVVVVGGGPAGSAAAQLLSSWGWSVCLVHRPCDRPTLAESLPPSTRKLLALVGQLDAVERAAFHPSCGTVARWAGAQRTTETDAPGFHVGRAAFDRVLRSSAAAANVRIVEGVVRRVEPGDPARVAYTTRAGESVIVHAPQVLDCSGRAGIVARRGFRRQRAGYRTLAIAADRYQRLAGTIFGLLFSVGLIGGMLFPFAVGHLSEHFGMRAAMLLPLFGAMVIVILAMMSNDIVTNAP